MRQTLRLAFAPPSSRLCLSRTRGPGMPRSTSDANDVAWQNNRDVTARSNGRLTGPTATTHPRSVRSFLRRVASVVCVLAFAQSALAQCAGWQATPEARRQCCQNGLCPLHHHEHSASPLQLTQAAADDCCAQSQRHESSLSGTVFALTMALPVLQSLPPVVLSLAPAAPLSAPWETPSPPAHVPKHLLLSVFLV